jgi:hypothetical protein
MAGMMKPSRRLLLILPAVLVAGLLAAWMLWPRAALTPENVAKLAKGMTLAEVEEILDRKADGTGSRAVPGNAQAEHVTKFWRVGGTGLRVDLDGDNRVSAILLFSLDETALARIRRWLGV